MIRIRRSAERGHANHGWLDTFHTFSFAEYHDPEWMGFRTLRVLNEDRVAPGKGFGTHPHRDMEIVSYVLQGTLVHRDSAGHGGSLGPGEVQYMSAGKGVLHSETNGSDREPLHFVQIWILPEAKGYVPRYDQRSISGMEERGRFQLVASPDGAQRSIPIRQDARVYLSLLVHGEKETFTLPRSRHLWLQVLRGSVDVNGSELLAGDGLAASDAREFALTGLESPVEMLLFDLG